MVTNYSLYLNGKFRNHHQQNNLTVTIVGTVGIGRPTKSWCSVTVNALVV